MANPAALRQLALIVSSAVCAVAQVNIEGHPFEIHGFFSQGFALSSGNNYLTMQTTDGAFDFTDGGLNVSTRIGEKFRVGVQSYVRNIGVLGNGHVTLDWATADYRFKDYFGIRAGQVKTVFGLYNDTQDLEFLHTWALLPQSLYPLDLRGLNLSHIGGDVYGSISPKRLGTFSYTAYLGKAPQDLAGGRAYADASYSLRLNASSGQLRGADLKWNTPIQGLLVGAAYLNSPQHFSATNTVLDGTLTSDSKTANVVLSAQYNRGRLKIDYERGRTVIRSTVRGASGLGAPEIVLPYDERAWYSSLAYRVWSHLELGTYHSRFYPNANKPPPYLDSAPAAARHVYDQALTARIDFKTHWDLKIEGHYIDGYGDSGSSRGFYLLDNPQGLQPITKLLVVRLGINY